MKTIKILALNFGSTSTKIAYFENDVCKLKKVLEHSSEELSQFPSFWDQEDYRKSAIENFLNESNLLLQDMDAFSSWGGQIKHCEDGVYQINDLHIEQVLSGKYGCHPGDLAPKVAYAFGQEIGVPAFVVDPPAMDEYNEYAHISGVPEIRRECRVHTLNQKAVARRFAKDIGKEYHELRLIITHMGGGTSVVAHANGKMIDSNDGLEGSGPMATGRAGTVPAGELVKLCYSGKYTENEMHRKLMGEAGLVAYLNENDSRKVEKRIDEGDEKAQLIYNAMLYQTAKEIGAMAAVLEGRVDAVIFTGGMANSTYVIERLKAKTAFIAPIVVYPGELELESEGVCAYLALTGKMEIKEVQDV